MAVLRDRPYAQFNFIVEIGDVDSDSFEAGFAKVKGLDAHVDVIEYRTGNSKSSEPMKLTGLSRVGNVTLKRGVIGSLKLWEWFDQVRSGDHTALRTVTIHLQSEDRSDTVMTWVLVGARPVRLENGPLEANGDDLAIEKLVLAYERLRVE